MIWQKKIVFILLFILVGLPVLGTVWLNLYDGRGWLSDQVEARIGKSATVGRYGIELGWPLEFYATDVVLENAPWAEDKASFTAQRMTAVVALRPLLKGDFRISRIRLHDARVWVEEDLERGLSNFEYGFPGTAQSSPLRLDIRSVQVERGQIVYRSGTGRRWLAEIDRLSLHNEGPDTTILGAMTGRLEGLGVHLNARLGTFNALLAQSESPLDITAYLGPKDMLLRAKGSARSLAVWKGLDLDVTGTIADLRELSVFAGSELPTTEPVDFSLDFIQPDSPASARIENLNMSMQSFGARIDLSGVVGALFPVRDMSLNVRLAGELSHKELERVFHDHAAPQLSGALSISGSAQAFTIKSRNAAAKINENVITLTGMLTKTAAGWSADAGLAGTFPKLDVFRVLPAGLTEAIPDITVTADLDIGDQRIELTGINLVTAGADEIVIDGPIVLDGRVLAIASEYALHLAGSTLNMLTREQLPFLLDELSGTGRITYQDSNLVLADNRLEFAGPGMTGFAQGDLRVSNSRVLGSLQSGFTLDHLHRLDTGTDRQDTWQAFLLSAGPVSAAGKLVADDQGVWALDELQMTLDDKQIQAHITGRIDDVFGAHQTRLNMQSTLMDTQWLHDWPGLDPAPWFVELVQSALPVAASADIHGRLDAAGKPVYEFKGLALQSRADAWQGSVEGDPVWQDGVLNGSLRVDLQGKASTTLAKSVVSHFGAPAFWQNLAGSDMNIQGNVSFAEALEPADINVQIDNESHTLTISGDIDRIQPFSSRRLEVHFSSRDLAQFFPSAHIQPDRELALRAVLSPVPVKKGQALQIEVWATQGDNDLSGVIEVKDDDEHSGGNGKPRTRISANVHSASIDLTQLFLQPEESEKIISDDVMTIAMSQWLTGDIHWQMDRYRDFNVQLHQARWSGRLSDSKLNFDVSGGAGEGELQADGMVHFDSDGIVREVAMNLVGENLSPAVFVKLGDAQDNPKGVVSIMAAINGKGHTWREVLTQGDGSLLLDLRGVRFRSQGLQIFGGDLLLGILTATNPFLDQSALLSAECGVLKFIIRDGEVVADKGLALKTRRFTLLGSGRIDLHDESMMWMVSTKARTGLGINANSLAKMLQVGGTLSAPRVETNLQGLLQSGIAIGAALASGGISLLAQGVYDRIRAGSDVCGAASAVHVSEAAATADTASDAANDSRTNR